MTPRTTRALEQLARDARRNRAGRPTHTQAPISATKATTRRAPATVTRRAHT